MNTMFRILSWCGVALLSASIVDAVPPRALIKDLSNRRGSEISSVQSLPQPLQQALPGVFAQDKLDLANPAEHFSGDTFVIRERDRTPPARRLLFAFETAGHFIVYLEYGPPAIHTSALAFRKNRQRKPVFIWGGTELGVQRRAKTPAELSNRISKNRFDDEPGTLW
jgi:hypothetical protein